MQCVESARIKRTTAKPNGNTYWEKPHHEVEGILGYQRQEVQVEVHERNHSTLSHNTGANKPKHKEKKRQAICPQNALWYAETESHNSNKLPQSPRRKEISQEKVQPELLKHAKHCNRRTPRQPGSFQAQKNNARNARPSLLHKKLSVTVYCHHAL